MLPWVAEVAHEMHIPSAFLAIQCATSFAIYHSYFNCQDGPFFHEHIKILEQDCKPCVLVNTFNELEEASIKVVDSTNVIPIGPLIPSAFSDGNDPTDKSFGGNFFAIPEKDCIQWLDSKPEKSVVYVSIGSFVALKKEER
ncbi:UDP-glycosyltransferase 75C1-like [Coffea eugenioides]|uniref:UDP-glycosyltransferase 75C1-like n=1 Tax=Coffea eugenioides TaxID=49369 RepID=UPI000F60A164|nr:UDP-glycosyltransferase 75C1-like [Coffea eugenioides]